MHIAHETAEEPWVDRIADSRQTGDPNGEAGAPLSALFSHYSSRREARGGSAALYRSGRK